MDPLVLKKLNKAKADRKAAMVVTNLSDGRGRLVLESDKVEGELGAAISNIFKSGKSAKIEIGGQHVFLNVHVPSPKIVAIGAVHITQALAPMAKIAGFDLSIVDPRTAFATEERFNEAKLYAEWPHDVMDKVKLDRYTALAAVTHDPKIDDFPLIEALKAECFYVGALGSRKTHAKRVERLKEQGASDAQIARIKSPIGLDIGASSPQEIAVAIIAEIVSAFRYRELG